MSGSNATASQGSIVIRPEIARWAGLAPCDRAGNLQIGFY